MGRFCLAGGPGASRILDNFSLGVDRRIRHGAGMEFSPVTALAEANVYFDGKVVSHTILFADGSKKTLGIIFPGSYRFGTASAERMDITAGTCRVELYGSEDVTEYKAGQAFEVPAQSGFSITVDDAPCQYVCSFLD
jgi:hypothetical protein